MGQRGAVGTSGLLPYPVCTQLNFRVWPWDCLRLNADAERPIVGAVPLLAAPGLPSRALRRLRLPFNWGRCGYISGTTRPPYLPPPDHGRGSRALRRSGHRPSWCTLVVGRAGANRGRHSGHCSPARGGVVADAGGGARGLQLAAGRAQGRGMAQSGKRLGVLRYGGVPRLGDAGRWSADRRGGCARGWLGGDGRTRHPRPRLTATVDIDGITEPGLVLTGRASVTNVDRHVSLSLVYHNALNLGGAIDRIDWKPLDAHVNKGVGPPRLRFIRIEGTHRHAWELNAALGVKAVVDDLPVAEPIEPDLGNWDVLLQLAATCWRIADLSMFPVPPWQYGLLSLPPRAEIPGGRE